MKSVTSWLLVMFMIMFWIFRIAVAFQAQYAKDLGGFIALDYQIEVPLLFLTVLCFILVLKRFLIGGILYMASYGYYFGTYIMKNLSFNEVMSTEITQNILVSALGVILAFCVLIDLIIAKTRKRDPKDQKTDWFFQNEQYDRKKDSREDKNEYRNY